MVAPKDFAWSFRNVAVHPTGAAYFAASHDASMQRDIPVTYYMRWGGTWGSKPFNINGTGICILTGSDPCLIIGGVDWSMLVISRSGSNTETVDSSDASPFAAGDLRELREIGGMAYAVGMGRTVYRRLAPGAWERLDQGVRMERKLGVSGGFNSIDGTSQDDLVAVGWNGEIWLKKLLKWERHESPTNVALFRVVRTPEGEHFAVGQVGTILRIAGGRVQAIEHDLTREDFYGAVFFKGALYVAASNSLFRLVGDALEEVPVVGPRPITLARNDCFYRLATNGSVIYSAGPKMVVWSEDGASWNELPYR